MKISLGDFVIVGGKSLAEEPFDLRIECHASVQILQSFRAKTARPIGRGNRRIRLSFGVIHHHSSIGAATEFLLLHSAAMTAEKTCLSIIAESEIQRGFYLGDATIESVESFQEGNTTKHFYVILGSEFSSQEPNFRKK